MKNINCPFCNLFLFKGISSLYCSLYCSNIDCQDLGGGSKINVDILNNKIIYLSLVVYNKYRLSLHYDLNITILYSYNKEKYLDKIITIPKTFSLNLDNLLEDGNKVVEKLLTLQALS